MSKPPRTGRSLADLIALPAEERPPPPIERASPTGQLDGKASPILPIAVDQGGKPKTFFVTPADAKYLKQVELDADMNLHNMVREALSEWLERRGLRPLEPQSANRQAPGRKRD